jgi:hypothetical protein
MAAIVFMAAFFKSLTAGLVAAFFASVSILSQSETWKKKV